MMVPSYNYCDSGISRPFGKWTFQSNAALLQHFYISSLFLMTVFTDICLSVKQLIFCQNWSILVIRGHLNTSKVTYNRIIASYRVTIFGHVFIKLYFFKIGISFRSPERIEVILGTLNKIDERCLTIVQLRSLFSTPNGSIVRLPCLSICLFIFKDLHHAPIILTTKKKFLGSCLIDFLEY